MLDHRQIAEMSSRRRRGHLSVDIPVFDPSRQLLEARAATISSAPSATSSSSLATPSCAPNDTSPQCQKPTDTPIIPIALGIIIPALIAVTLFVFLHRRHKQRVREEDRNDRTKSLDFGMQFPGAKDKPTRRQRGMSLDVDSPYVLPQALRNSRGSMSSLSLPMADNDKYSPVTAFITQSRNNSMTGSMHGFPAQQRVGLGLEGADPRSQSRSESRNGSKLGYYNTTTEIREPPAAVQRSNAGSRLGMASADTRDSYIDNNTNDLRRSHDYLAGFLKSRNSTMPNFSSPAKTPSPAPAEQQGTAPPVITRNEFNHSNRSSDAIGESLYASFSRERSPERVLHKVEEHHEESVVEPVSMPAKTDSKSNYRHHRQYSSFDMQDMTPPQHQFDSYNTQQEKVEPYHGHDSFVEQPVQPAKEELPSGQHDFDTQEQYRPVNRESFGHSSPPLKSTPVMTSPTKRQLAPRGIGEDIEDDYFAATAKAAAAPAAQPVAQPKEVRTRSAYEDFIFDSYPQQKKMPEPSLPAAPVEHVYQAETSHPGRDIRRSEEMLASAAYDSKSRSRPESTATARTPDTTYSRHLSIAQRSDNMAQSTESSVGTTHHSVMSDFDFDRNENYPPTPPSITSNGDEVKPPAPKMPTNIDTALSPPPSADTYAHPYTGEYQEHHDDGAVRPLPAHEPNENKQQRTERIRSFYKDYFDASGKAVQRQEQPQAQHHDQQYQQSQYEQPLDRVPQQQQYNDFPAPAKEQHVPAPPAKDQHAPPPLPKHDSRQQSQTEYSAPAKSQHAPLPQPTQHDSQQQYPAQHQQQYEDEYYDEWEAYDNHNAGHGQQQHYDQQYYGQHQQYDQQGYHGQYQDQYQGQHNGQWQDQYSQGGHGYGQQSYDDSGYMYDYETGEYYPSEPQAPFMQAPMRRAFTPPPRAPPRFNGRSGHSSQSSFASHASYGRHGPRAHSSASNRYQPPRKTKPRAPPQPLLNLPTPHKLATDAQIMNMLDFAPPTTYRDRAGGMSDTESLRGGLRPYSPSVRAHTPLASAYDELPSMPSPHMLRKSGTFTALDFAPVPKLFKDNGSDHGSMRSTRSGVSQVHSHNIRSGAYRVSRLPADMVPGKMDLSAQLKPTWGMRQHDG